MINCINLIKISIKNNKKGFILNNKNKNLSILKPLLKLNWIKFIKIKNKKIIVYINYINKKTIFRNIKILYKKSNLMCVSYNNLKKLNSKHNWMFIISTSKGILNTLESLNNKIGGILIAKLWN